MSTWQWVSLGLYLSGVALHWHTIALLEAHASDGIDENQSLWKIYRVGSTLLWPVIGVFSVGMMVRDAMKGSWQPPAT